MPLVIWRNFTREPIKFIISEVPEKLDEYCDVLPKRLILQLYLTRFRHIFLEIFHPAVSKVEGLKVLGDRLGIGLAEMMAVGDSYNNVETLKAVGLDVAIGNAPPDVQAQADWVTTGIEDEGLVVAFKKYIIKED